jgi:hypothetical protein
VTTRELQKIKQLARLKAAGLIWSALELGQCTESLMEIGLSEHEANLVVKELGELAKRLEEG